MEFHEIVKNFPTTPFLFIGSGFSRRYYNLPDWKGLLQVFVKRLNDDEFAFNKYLNDAKNIPSTETDGGHLAVAAQLIMKDFDKRWFEDRSFRNLDEEHLKLVHNGQSPFKVEISQYIKEHSHFVSEMSDELNVLKNISKRSISGIITTNYDQLLENITGYKVFIGQEELIFSPLQGFGEIYKIHGCISNPQDIVITDHDYQKFRNKCPYLAAKLMTTFMEYPIIFMGYSITDTNINLILNELGKCLSPKNLEKLQNRFVYIQYKRGINELKVFKHSVNIGDRIIDMTGITTDNFMEIYKIISEKKAALPAKLFRIFKESFYEYALSNTPNEYIKIGTIDDQNIDDEDLVMGIARPSEFSIKGLYGVSREAWFYNIIIHNLPYSPDDLLEAYKKIKQRGKLPVNFLLSKATYEHKLPLEDRYKDIDDIINETIRNNRKSRKIQVRSISGILHNRGNTTSEKQLALFDMVHLNKEEINIDELYLFLKNTIKDKNFINDISPSYKTHLFQLISIYDCLKYSKEVKEDWS